MIVLRSILALVLGLGPFVLALIAGRREGPGWLKMRVASYSLICLYMAAIGVSTLTGLEGPQSLLFALFPFIFAIAAGAAAVRSFRALQLSNEALPPDQRL